MVIATVTSADEFFAKLPKKADVVASTENSNPVEIERLIGVIGDIALQWATSPGHGIPLDDPRLAGALIVEQATVN